MDASAIVVAIAAAAAIAGLGWYFFGPRKAHAAQLAGGVQRLEVTVRGGYSPEVIRLRQGVPAELTFDRQESGDCTSRVVFGDLRVSAALPAHQRTVVHLEPAEAGSTISVPWIMFIPHANPNVPASAGSRCTTVR